MRALPIDPLLPNVVDTLRSGTRLVLRAPPGAGKTTRVPAAILDAGLGAAGDIVVLEPRRIAARAAAEFVAGERGGSVGGEIGYRVRFEQRGGDATRLWFLTEGVFSRRLVKDPFLERVGVVVLDEFHERHLQGDIALGVVRELQDTVRPDLRLVVMSATLDTGRLAAFLGDCPVLTSEGRTFPVEVEFAETDAAAPLPIRVSAALRRVLGADGTGGDVLVFLPGAAAIRRTAEAIGDLVARHDLELAVLHGDLPLEEQHRALFPSDRRKIVLSTNVAETSLTIEGVTTVIDSGLAREARFDPRHGLNRLEEVRVSRASAEQRAGRAGRTRPGRCLRLWTRADHEGRKERELPEILRLDLSATVLELRAWGARDIGRFAWLDPPGEATVASAEKLLVELGALDGDSGALTAIGKRMLDLGVAPRLGRILVEAEHRRCAADGTLVAALASERDIVLERRSLAGREISPWPTRPSDLLPRIELFREAARQRFDHSACRALGLDARAVRAVDRARRQLAETLRARDETAGEPELVLECVLAGYPDRVVRRRRPGSTRGVMVGGGGVRLDPGSVVREEELFVAVDLDAGPRRERSEASVRIASGVRREWLERTFPQSVRTVVETLYDPERERVVTRTRELYEDLVLAESVGGDVDPLRAADLLETELRRDPAGLIAAADREAFLERLRFLARANPAIGFPEDPLELVGRAIPMLVAGRRSLTEAREADLLGALRSLLSAEQRKSLERDAPDRYRLPSGRTVPIAYARDRPPSIAARIQDLFGLAATPKLGGGRVSLVIEILAPNQRPVQVTDDLASFWARTYPEVRKQLRGRYPKHAWPESPDAE